MHTSILEVNTKLIERLGAQREVAIGTKRRARSSSSSSIDSISGSSSTSSDSNSSTCCNSDPLHSVFMEPATFVRECPPLNNPEWADEEMARLCADAGVWSGTTLSVSVWGAPGTSECPFSSRHDDFVECLPR